MVSETFAIGFSAGVAVCISLHWSFQRIAKWAAHRIESAKPDPTSKGPLFDTEVGYLYSLCYKDSAYAYSLVRRLHSFGVVPDPPYADDLAAGKEVKL